MDGPRDGGQMSATNGLRRIARTALLGLFLPSLLTLGAGAYAGDEVVVEGDDLLAPTLTSVTLSPASVDVTSNYATVDIRFLAEDDVSGLQYGFFSLRGPGVTYDSWSNPTLVEGTLQDGTFTTHVYIPLHAPDGIYTLSQCKLRDFVSRESSATCPSTQSVTVVNNLPDLAPPSLTTASISPATLDVSAADATATVTFAASDDVSGLQYGFFSLRGPGVTYDSWSNPTLVEGTTRDGTFTTTVHIPRHAPAGTYTLTYCRLRDFTGRESANSCPSATPLTVVSSTPDLTPPHLSEISLTPTTVNVTESFGVVTATFKATDDVSGLQYSFFTLKGPGVSYNSWSNPSLVDGTTRDGTFTTTFYIPRHAPVGSYSLSYCRLRDLVQRSSATTCVDAPQVGVVDDSVDLVASWSDPPTSATPGGGVRLSGTVRNLGPAAPVAPRLAVLIPPATTVGPLPSGCELDAGVTTVFCDLPADQLDPGESLTRTIPLTLDSDAAGTITASATASSSSLERSPANNTATLSIPIVQPEPDPTDPPVEGPSDLSLTATADRSMALPGDVVAYTFTARNAVGAGTATDATLENPLPEGMSFVSGPEECAEANGEVTCDLGDLAPGSSKVSTIWASVDPIPMLPDPNTAHQLTETKAESHLTVGPRSQGTATVSCPSGSFATDGGARLDHVDQGGSFADLRVLASEATADGTGWTITLANDSLGNAQAKATVACLASRTSSGAHEHELTRRSVDGSHALPSGTNTVELPCATNELAHAPSYAFTHGSGEVLASQPTATGWSFTVRTDESATVDLGVTCLSKRTSSAAGHFHTLGLHEVDTHVAVAPGESVETQLTCANSAKGIVASHRTDPGLVNRGSDPRAQTRTFRYTNPGGVGALTADLGLTCLDIRTSGEPVARKITNTATVTTTAVDRTTADDSASVTITAYGDGWATVPMARAVVRKAGGAARVTAPVRCASDCVVSARLVAVRRVQGTGLRKGDVLARGKRALAGGPETYLSLRGLRAASKPLLRGKVSRARLVVTTTDGATFRKVVRLRR